MASQFLTVALLVGESSVALSSTLDAWASMRISDDPSELNPTQWPHNIRVALDTFVESLAANANTTSVAYYSRHFDTWSMGDIFSRLMQPQSHTSPIRVLSARFELWARVVGKGHEIANHAAEFSHQHKDTPEYRWISNRIREAASCYQHEFEHGTLLLIREVTGGLVLDNDRLFDTVAPWIPSSDG